MAEWFVSIRIDMRPFTDALKAGDYEQARREFYGVTETARKAAELELMRHMAKALAEYMNPDADEVAP